MARILLAEDYDDLREMIRELLQDQEHLVEAYADGADAMESLKKHEFDLLILDWELPKVLGIDICRDVRARGADTPILILTAKKAVAEKEQGFDAGADDYLTKPFHPKELTARIKALLRRNEKRIVAQCVPDQLAPGTIFADRYQIMCPLGRGSTGTIYKALHRFLNRIVALKVLHPQLVWEPEAVARFRREAQAVSSLQHPNIIGACDFGIARDGTPYLVMDYAEGISLAEKLKQNVYLDLKEALPIFIQACDALSHAHSRTVIHRDVKPGNMLLLSKEQGPDVLKLVDFGIARVPLGGKAMQITQDGDILGSPLYMSPEQVMGNHLDTRTDIFSLGCVMYISLLGVEPFMGDNVLDTMYRRTVEDPKPFELVRPGCNLPDPLESIVMKSLARNPEDRYQSMEELKTDLEKVACLTV